MKSLPVHLVLEDKRCRFTLTYQVQSSQALSLYLFSIIFHIQLVNVKQLNQLPYARYKSHLDVLYPIMQIRLL